MAARTISNEFRNVDNAETADRLVQYLEYVDSQPQTRQTKADSYGYLGLKEGDCVLDAGCGPGYDALRMAAMVGKRGKVTGIDLSERMIAIAEAKAKGTSLPVSFRTGDVRKLPFPDASFDKVRIERTLQILGNPGQVLDEMIRVLRPGGRLLSVEPDWETMVCDPGSRDTARVFFRFCADQFPDGSTGRKLYRYFRERGLSDVTVHPAPLVLHDFSLTAKMMNMEQFLAAAQEKGVLGKDDVASWLADLKAADAKGHFTFAGLMFAVVGRK
ncbi:MAG: tRNA (adenine(57)-N(1)/adenine(58)-N(1))-methyltransferase TrmI [Methanoregula sp. PtaU1.Bin006]|nr:MAG: tRNA (adenine(57)-N(1)/adenine(58)-N(1))-methyltransferase TrmI [Methanoregula sp. PtaB.Bin085]OPY34698.1 MAG: tRNA (adenine(57)-N(1)/adenine(58)-N(1))-methyltransferase TrmI [Methanoregula sp. PtaU1.Bin006]